MLTFHVVQLVTLVPNREYLAYYKTNAGTQDQAGAYCYSWLQVFYAWGVLVRKETCLLHRMWLFGLLWPGYGINDVWRIPWHLICRNHKPHLITLDCMSSVVLKAPSIHSARRGFSSVGVRCVACRLLPRGISIMCVGA